MYNSNVFTVRRVSAARRSHDSSINLHLLQNTRYGNLFCSYILMKLMKNTNFSTEFKV